MKKKEKIENLKDTDEEKQNNHKIMIENVHEMEELKS